MAQGEKSETKPDPDRQIRLRLLDAWDNVLEGNGLWGRFFSIFLLVILALGSALLLGPRGYQSIPYDADDVGRFAVGTIKAYRNYRIEDIEATEHKRNEAAEAVLAVYDHDSGVPDGQVKRIREAFRHMQNVWRDHQSKIIEAIEKREALEREVLQETDLPDDEQSDSSATEESSREVKPDETGVLADAGQRDDLLSKTGQEQPTEGKNATEEKSDYSDQRSWESDPILEMTPEEVFASEKDVFIHLIQVPVDDSSFNILAREKFSPEIEQALIRLLREAMSKPIIIDSLLREADRARGITLRPVPARDLRRERIISDVDGEIRDLVAARALVNHRLSAETSSFDPDVQEVTGRIAGRLVRPTLVFNREETEKRRIEARENVRTTFIELEAGEKIIGDGERIDNRHLVIFQGIKQQAAEFSTLNVYFGAGLLAVLVCLTMIGFAGGSIWGFSLSRKDLLFLLTVFLGTLLALRGGMFLADALADRMVNASASVLYYAIPAGTSVVLVRLVLRAEATLVFAVLISVMAGVLVEHNLGYALMTCMGGLVAAHFVGKTRDRNGIWQAGMLMALVNVLLVVSLGLHEGREFVSLFPVLVAAAVAGAVMPVFVLGLTILVENVFRYTTDLKLLELANLNNSLLKELVVSAPGTYHHSMMIGNMVEAAAEAIGANPLLARVGAYYHDIGKGRNPLYFAENQKGENPHDKLSPNMSVLIIRRHVSDGVKMARSAGLPKPLIDMIPMHHGTRQVSYFWHKVKEDAEKRGDPVPSDTDFRYGGPKPRFREAALLMIADSVEAAARTLVEPSTDRLRGLVQKVINGCFADGQFDECNITLKDLHAIAGSFVRSLSAIYHTRPEYQQPAVKGAEKAKNGDKSKTSSTVHVEDNDSADEKRENPDAEEKNNSGVRISDTVPGDNAEHPESGLISVSDEDTNENVEVLKRLGADSNRQPN